MSANEGDCAVNPPSNNLLKIFIMQKIGFVISFQFFWKCFSFDNFSVISPTATSTSASSKLYLIILALVSSKLLISAINKFRFSTSIVSFSAARPCFQKLISSFINALQDKILSKCMTSQGPTRHRLLLICLYCENLCPIESLLNLLVTINS